MRHLYVSRSQAAFAIFVLMSMVAPAAGAAGGPALEQPRALGSAIAPGFTLKPDVLRPFEVSAVEACVTNQNPRSRRTVASGDELRFALTGGASATCGGVSVVPADSALDADGFACDVDGDVVTLRRTGGPVAWPAGDAVCASLSLTPGGESFVVRSGVQVSNEGAWSPVSPASVLVNVAPELGIPGPEGPAGPAGPPGPSGPPGSGGGIGARAFRVTTDFLTTYEGDPPVLIPGLEASLTVGTGAQLLVLADVGQWDCTYGTDSIGDAIVYLEVDGSIVASRELEYGFTHTWTGTIAWLSPPLEAGPHSVRVLGGGDGSQVPGSLVSCIGGPFHPDHYGMSRLVALEVSP